MRWRAFERSQTTERVSSAHGILTPVRVLELF